MPSLEKTPYSSHPPGVESPTRYPAAEALGVVRGGNYDDSLPIYYQTRGRYPYFPVDGGKGFRCVF